jgi:hypothetical protein
MNDLAKPVYPPPRRKRLRGFLYGLLLGLGVLICLSIWSAMMRTSISPTSEKKDDQAQQVQARPDQSAAAAPRVVHKAAAGSNSDLQSQMEQVLSGIKEANQKKNLSQFLSYYSPNFPQLPQRAQSIAKDWKVYDYPKMEFEINEVRLLADNTAVVKVTWNVEVQNISTKKIKNVSKTYLTRFVKESGQWRIKALDKTE